MWSDIDTCIQPIHKLVPKPNNVTQVAGLHQRYILYTAGDGCGQCWRNFSDVISIPDCNNRDGITKLGYTELCMGTKNETIEVIEGNYVFVVLLTGSGKALFCSLVSYL